MRKLFLSLLVLVPFVVSAQNTKPFKVNVAAGYAAPANRSGSNDLSKAGFVYNIEPQYRLIKNVDVGLRVEQAFIRRPEVLNKDISLQTQTESIVSGVITATYSIDLGSAFQPFLGLGAGLYHTAPSEQSDTRFGITTRYPLPATNVIGGLARVGVKLGRANLVADYNLVSDSQVKNSATNLTLAAKNSYFSIKAGFIIGGGSDK